MGSGLPEWENINLEMLKVGLSKLYRGRTPQGFDLTPYLKAETEAKDTNKGIWNLRDDDRSPQEWYKTHKKK